MRFNKIVGLWKVENYSISYIIFFQIPVLPSRPYPIFSSSDMRTRQQCRRASPSTTGTTRNAGEHEGEISNENRGDIQPRSWERLAENGEDHRRKILTKNGVKSRGNCRKIVKKLPPQVLRSRWGSDGNGEAPPCRNGGITMMIKSWSQNHKLSPRDIVGGGARSRSSVLVSVNTGPSASSR